MFAIMNIKTGEFVYGTDFNYRPHRQRTSKERLLTYKTLEEAAWDLLMQRKCGSDYQVVKLKTPEIETVYDTKSLPYFGRK